MGKKSSKQPLLESALLFPLHPALSSIPKPELVDTHTHILSTYLAYCKAFPPPNHDHKTLADFVRNVVLQQGVGGCVDVWCEAPVTANWEEVVNSLIPLDTEGFDYHFVIGCHPHEAKHYDEVAAKTIEAAHRHERCVGWGEMGLDYHYDNSPRELQRDVLRRQIRTALGSGLGKALTIHTREADDDIYDILTSEVPKKQKIHVHCFTDTPELASKLLAFFPNLYIGITGVATYTSNLNTSNVLRALGDISSPAVPGPLRILLETDGPFMIPSALQKGRKLPLCHSAMLPFTAEYVAQVLNEGKGEAEDKWTTEGVLIAARENARFVYGV